MLKKILIRALPAVFASAALLAPSLGAAQDWPTAKPVRVIAVFPPGGSVDQVARILAEALRVQLNQSVIVENIGGASGVIGTAAVAKAAPDGYTMLIGSPSAISVNPALNPKLTYKPSDLMPITKMTTSPLVLAVTPTSPIKSVPDLIAAAKKDPGKLNYSTSGNGSAPHLGMALFNLLTGTEMTHVPYRGAAAALADVIAGKVPVYFDQVASSLPHIQAGRLRALAVSWRERLDVLPAVPTYAGECRGHAQYPCGASALALGPRPCASLRQHRTAPGHTGSCGCCARASAVCSRACAPAPS